MQILVACVEAIAFAPILDTHPWRNLLPVTVLPHLEPRKGENIVIDASRKRIAVLCGLGDGGMEIALVRLLQDLDYNQVSVTLLTAERQGPLLNMLPDQVAVRHCHFTSAFAYAIGVNDFSDCGTGASS